MAVTAAQARQALAMRGFQEGELAVGDRQVETNPAPSVAKELPLLLIRRAQQFRLRAPC